jgi:radical SAM protein (TIGR01212 family)
MPVFSTFAVIFFFNPMEYPWGNTRRFNSYISYCKQQYGHRLQKLSIDAGFTCPNRDGTKGSGGCTYCSNDAFNPSYCHPQKSILTQIEEGIEFHRTRYKRAGGYIAYFQAYSNTYAPLEILKQRYGEALSHPLVTGISIGTRPDCISGELLQYLSELRQQKEVSIEYGIESVCDQTLTRICRGHDFACAERALAMTAEYGIPASAHFIFGLPGERIEAMLASADTISKLPLQRVKFHQLQIVKGTEMEKEFLRNPGDFVTFTLDSYIDFIIRFLERLSPQIMIERLSGEMPPAFTLGPGWGMIRNDQVLNRIEKVMQERDSYQGKCYHAQ